MPGLAALGALPGIVGALVPEAAGPIKSLADLGAGTGGLNLGGPVAVVPSSSLSDDHFIDLICAAFASVPTGVDSNKVAALWLANYESYAGDPDDLKFFQELGLVADAANPTKAEKQFIALFAVIVTTASRNAREVESDWKATRKGRLRSEANLAFLRSKGLIG